MSRLKYGRDINLVNMEINRRADLDRVEDESAQNNPSGFPPIDF
jgi:hypothetical protein